MIKIIFLALFIPIAILVTINLFPDKKNEQPVKNEIPLEIKKASGIGLPTRLIIPGINVDAPIRHLGLAPDGSIGAPEKPGDTAWFTASARPGEKGSSVITGHYGPWRNGDKSVFDNLSKLEEGNMIYVSDDKGNLMPFRVEKIRIYGLDESVPELLNRTDGVYLNIVTCSGDWLQNQKTYSNRLVVFAKKPSKPITIKNPLAVGLTPQRINLRPFLPKTFFRQINLAMFGAVIKSIRPKSKTMFDLNSPMAIFIRSSRSSLKKVVEGPDERSEEGLPGQDSDLDKWLQRPLSYHWTTRQYSIFYGF